MRGRKPDSIVTGNSIASTPRAPACLSANAKGGWRRVVPLLIERRILTDADLGVLESYCVAIGSVREAPTKITVTPRGN